LQLVETQHYLVIILLCLKQWKANAAHGIFTKGRLTFTVSSPHERGYCNILIATHSHFICLNPHRTEPFCSRLPSPCRQTQPTQHPSHAQQIRALLLTTVHSFEVAFAVAYSQFHLELTSTRFDRRCSIYDTAPAVSTHSRSATLHINTDTPFIKSACLPSRSFIGLPVHLPSSPIMDAAQGKRKRDEPADRRNTSTLDAPKKSMTATTQGCHFTGEHVAKSLPSPEPKAGDVAVVDKVPLAFATEFVDQAALEQLLSPDSLNAVGASTSPDAAIEEFADLFEVPLDSPHDSTFALFNDKAGDDTLESIENYMHTEETSSMISHPVQATQNTHDNLFAANPNDIPSFDDWAEEVQKRHDHRLQIQRPGNSHLTPQNPEAQLSLQQHSQTTQQSPQHVPLSPEQMSAAFDHWLRKEFREAHGGRSSEDIQELYTWGHLALMPEFSRKYGRIPNCSELQDFFTQQKVAHGILVEDKDREQNSLSLQQQTHTPAQSHQIPFSGQQKLVPAQDSLQQISRPEQQQQIPSQASQHRPMPHQSRLGQQHQIALPQFSSESDENFTDFINNMTLDQLKQHGALIQARMHPNDRYTAQRVAQIAELCVRRKREEQLSYEYTPQQVQQNINHMRIQQVQGNMSPRLTAELVQALNVRKLQETRMRQSIDKSSPEKSKENMPQLHTMHTHGNWYSGVTEPFAHPQAKVTMGSPEQQKNESFNINICTLQEAHHRMAQLKTAIENGNKSPFVAQQLAFLQQRFMPQSTPTQKRDPVNDAQLSPHQLQKRIADIKQAHAQGLQHPGTANELAILQKKLWDFLQQIPGNHLTLQRLQLKINLLQDFQARNPQRQDVTQMLNQHVHREAQLCAHIEMQKEKRSRKATNVHHSAQQHPIPPQQVQQMQPTRPQPTQAPALSMNIGHDQQMSVAQAQVGRKRKQPDTSDSFDQRLMTQNNRLKRAKPSPPHKSAPPISMPQQNVVSPSQFPFVGASASFPPIGQQLGSPFNESSFGEPFKNHTPLCTTLTPTSNLLPTSPPTDNLFPPLSPVGNQLQQQSQQQIKPTGELFDPFFSESEVLPGGMGTGNYGLPMGQVYGIVVQGDTSRLDWSEAATNFLN
jgi:hypothetical protein